MTKFLSACIGCRRVSVCYKSMLYWNG